MLPAQSAFAAVEVPGSAWLFGHGVPVCGPVGSPCPGVTPAPGEGPNNWQCVELAARLYETQGWVPRNIYVNNAYQMGNSAWANSYGLEFHPNGSGYIPVPGDLIITNEDSAIGDYAGHVAVVSDPYDPSKGQIPVVEEHYSPTGRATYQISGSTITRSGDPRQILGTIHGPANQYANTAATPTVAAALIPGTKAGYSLNGDGTLAPFGGASAATQAGHQWPNWDIARGVAILPNGTGGYVLDGYGGIHPFAIGSNPVPPAASGGPYWNGWDIARGLVLNPAGTGGYVLDGWGGLHPFAIGSNPMPAGTSGGPYWKGWDIARAVALNPAGTGGYVLDGYGGIHPFAIGGNPLPPAVHGAYWPNWDIARAIVIDFTGTSGYTLDGYGGLHPFYADGTPVPPAPQVSGYTSGQDLARAVVLYQDTQAADHPGGVSGVVLDADSAAPQPFTTGADGRAVAFLPGSSTAGYSLSGDGTLTPFGGAPAATQAGHQWPNWDIARSVAILPNGTGGYVLDGYGGIHPFAIGSNPMPAGTSGGPYWNGWDIARGLVLLPNGTGGYVLDGYGGIHPFATGSNPMPAGTSGGPYWNGWDIARGLVLLPNGTGGYVLDGYGGIHPFATGSNPMPAGTSGGPYWNGWDIARGLVLLPNGTGGYVLDGYGGIHPFAIGSNPAPPGISPGAYYGGWDVMDGLALGADGKTAAVVDSHDGVHLS